MSARPLTLILNARAAGDEELRGAVRSLRDAGHEIAVQACWEEGDPARFAAEAAREYLAAGRDDAVLVAGGGDGTVNEVVSALVSSGGTESRGGAAPIVGVLPYGTANDFANAAGLPVDDPARCLLELTGFTAHPADVGRLNGKPFMNAASAGYAARVTTETDPTVKKVLGGLAYWWTGLTNLALVDASEVTVTADGDEWTGKILAVIVGNGRFAGGGIAVTPHARIDDGRLEVTIVPDVGWTEYKSIYDDPPQRRRGA